MRMNLKKEKGITLISLVITIIVLIILAGVSINLVLGDNGIIERAKNAKKITNISSEEEAIKLLMMSKNIDESDTLNIGVSLYDRTLENGNKWNIISIVEPYKTYGTGWTYIEKGTELENYGKTNYSWCINIETGEMIQLEEDNYVQLAYGMNLAVKEGIILNVDPVNMSDEDSFGEGVTLYGVEEGDGYGYNVSELKFDGVDDYLEIYTDMSMDEGITFEFYAKGPSTKSLPLLAKTIKGETTKYSGRFRTCFSDNDFRCCMSSKKSGSDWQMNEEGMAHWIHKVNVGTFDNEKGNYLTMTVNLKNDTISLYWNGEFIGETVCNHDWLVNGKITDNTIPFTVGLMIGGSTYTETYSKIDLYACRLYNKVLTSEEVKNNYNLTTAYHNLLVEEN